MRKSETKCTRHSFAGSRCCKGCTCSCSESTGTAGLPFYQNASYYSFSFIALNSPRHLLEAKVGGVGVAAEKGCPLYNPIPKKLPFHLFSFPLFCKAFSLSCLYLFDLCALQQLFPYLLGWLVSWGFFVSLSGR